ncbi:1-hydroxycarotenoid 3,4-desaturase CrtD [Aureimonas glaciei]|uniref:Phytoene desaturase n=1 Tax=Aureimonas glaciei TaxID=1776957 RepID=A0A916XWL6_9HYPH|nr:1-hydroxycarotenoid 3,4-desaturase CrtD [Aureimonas glaciei]GGD17176.1 phytoene desaturase [Aureimonas glaciei]
MRGIPDTASRNTPSRRVVVVGAGVGGLVSALLLSASGLEVTVVERAARAGGKLREIDVAGQGIDSGPTIFTMRWVFEAIFAAAGARLEDHLSLAKAGILARHSFDDGSVFDLHDDLEKTVEAVERLAGAAEAKGYRAFSARTEEVFHTLNGSFMEHPAPSPLGLARASGLGGLAALSRIQPFTPLSAVIARYFRDPRLRQLFGRYATYCGASPFHAPGPLMLIAHVERLGVWLVDGGMARLAGALERLASERGAVFRYGTEASEIAVGQGRTTGVRLRSGELLQADAVVFNGDPMALATGLLGTAARPALPSWPKCDRSLSALTFSMRARTHGFPLSRHTVFFSADYAREFDDLLVRQRLPEDPTIYVCAQDRDAGDGPAPQGPERLFLLVNAPATGDSSPFSPAEIASCETRVMQRLARAGLTLSDGMAAPVTTAPADFAAMFPATGGALYGRASRGWASSFQRPSARTKLKGLYLAGGGVHPGPGIPMAALSGRHAAVSLMADLASTAPSRKAATSGGISMRSATTDVTP